MAEWKKVIVSGSSAVLSQLNVGTNQQITTSQATTFLTGSFTGSFKGDGTNLTGVTATATFPTLQTSPILSTTKLFSNDGSNTFVVAGQVTASAYAGVSGDITIGTGGVAAIGSGVIVDADVAAGAGIVYTKLNLGSSTIHSGSFFNGISVVSGSSQISYTGLSNTPVGIVSGSTLAAGSGQGSTTLTTNGVSSGDITATGLGTAGTPTFAGLTISTNAVAINNTNGITTNAATFPIANSTATTINLGGGATAVNIGASTGITIINHDARVKGALYVDGPITAISSSNLYVADQFILLASGSTTNTDGGIVIDRGSYAGLNIAYGFDSTTGRWGYQAGVTDTTNTLDPTGISGSFAGYVFTEAAHTATKPTTGEFVQAGAIYTNTDGTIWMYA